MRPIDLIVVHCTATPEGKQQTVADITRMHKARGFSTIGYHWLIGINGETWRGRPEAQVGAHVQNYNRKSIGVSYVGGVAKDGKTAKDTRTPAQKEALKKLLKELIARYPNAKIVGHRDLSPDRNRDGVVTPDEWIKQCPCFNAISEYKALKLPVGKKNMDLDLDAQAFPDGPQAAGARLAYDPQVEAVQRRLAQLGYALGDIDGKAGTLTVAAIAAFEKDNHLPVNGEIDPAFLELLNSEDAQSRPISPERANATAEDLRAKGSQTILTADNVKLAGGVAGAAGTFGAANETTDATTGTSIVERAQDALGIANTWREIADGLSGLVSWAVGAFWWIAIGAAGFFAVRWAIKLTQAKVEGYRKGEDIESSPSAPLQGPPGG